MPKIYVDALQRGTSFSPRAFPGKYPTRIWLLSRGSVNFTYLGKPDPSILTRVWREYILKGGNSAQLIFKEFDMNGVVFDSEEQIRSCAFYDRYFPYVRTLDHHLARSHRLVLFLHRKVLEMHDSKIYKFGEDFNSTLDGWYRSRCSKVLRGIPVGDSTGTIRTSFYTLIDEKLRKIEGRFSNKHRLTPRPALRADPVATVRLTTAALPAMDEAVHWTFDPQRGMTFTTQPVAQTANAQMVRPNTIWDILARNAETAPF